MTAQILIHTPLINAAQILIHTPLINAALNQRDLCGWEVVLRA